MRRKALGSLAVFAAATLFAGSLFAGEGGPRGAKAIFDSGEGARVGMSVEKQRPAAEPVAQADRYMGISYQIALLGEDGSFRMVPKSRVFKSGERVKMLVRTNRPGYMSILNVGPTGNTNVLFNDYVEAFTMHEIPRGTNMRFVGMPGTEKLIIMLSNNPNPILGGQSNITASNTPPPQSNYGSTPPPPQSNYGSTPPPPPPASYGSASSGFPPASDSGTLPPPPPVQAMVASLDGGKSVGPKKGSKDITLDSMETSYHVISPRNGWKPKSGGKDIVVESAAGSNYGVVPVSALADGGILTLEVKLKHK